MRTMQLLRAGCLGVCTIAFSLSLGVGAYAEPLTKTAGTELWLSGDDEQSFALLYDEAQGGTLSAQMLLGQIDRDIVPGGMPQYLTRLPEVERDRLLRAPSEGQTVNWLLVQSDPAVASLASSLFNYQIDSDSVQAAIKLSENGEDAAAEYMVWLTLQRGQFSALSAVQQQRPSLADLPMLDWIRQSLSSERVITLETLAADDHVGALKGVLLLDRISNVLRESSAISDNLREIIRVVNGRPSADTNLAVPSIRQSLVRLAQNDDYLAQLAALCASCENGEADFYCIAEALRVIDGYRSLMRVRTPIENVIPNADFLQTPRASQTLKQLIVSRSVFYREPLNSQCVASWVDQAGENSGGE